MNVEERKEAILGSFDGVVSITGFVFGLLVHKSPESAIAIGGLGGAVAAGVSMGAGELAKHDGKWYTGWRIALVMLIASITGSMIAIWPYFIFDKSVALVIAGLGCVLVATWIGYEKRKGLAGYVTAYVTLIVAAGLTLGVVSLIPQSG